MKTILRSSFILILVCCGFSASSADVSVNGPAYTCPDSELVYKYLDNSPGIQVLWTITNGKIYNIFSQTWESEWLFNRSVHSDLNNTWPFRIKWNAAALGTIGTIHVKICNSNGGSCSTGSLAVTFGPSPGTPIISGSNYILNCLNEQKQYTVSNIPQNWNLVDWTYPSQIQQIGGTVNSNPVTISGTNTTYTGNQTLTGVFHFITDGKQCGTKSVNKNIWIGRPNPTSLTVNGGAYYGGGVALCGDSWVGVEYSSPVSSTSWTFDPPLPYYYSSATQCNFYVDLSWPSTWRITAVGTNACGAGYAALYYLNQGCYGFMISTFPNPATNELTIQTSGPNGKGSLNDGIIASEVSLVDKSGLEVIKAFPTESTINFNTREIPQGEYFLHVRIGDQIFKKHILINK